MNTITLERWSGWSRSIHTCWRSIPHIIEHQSARCLAIDFALWPQYDIAQGAIAIRNVPKSACVARVYTTKNLGYYVSIDIMLFSLLVHLLSFRSTFY